MTGPGRLCPSPPLPKQGFLGPLNWLMDGSAAGRQVGPQVAGLLPHWAVEGPPHVLLRAMPVHSAHGPSGQTRMSPLHWPAVALRQGMRQPVAGATPPGPHPPPPSIAASPPKQGRGACGSVAFLPGEARFHPGGYAPFHPIWQPISLQVDPNVTGHGACLQHRVPLVTGTPLGSLALPWSEGVEGGDLLWFGSV